MALKQSTPGGGEGKARLHFSYVPTSAKLSWHAYVAGPAMWFDCHDTGKTKPCLREVTDGELECPRCGEIKPPVETGYLPLYRATDYKPVVVIVHTHTREIVDALRFHARVLVMRQHGVGEGVQVTHALDQLPKFQTTLPERQRPVQPFESLLRMWGYPSLIEWFNARTGANIPVCHTPPRQKATPAKSVPPLPTAPAVSGDMSETTMETLARITARNEQWVRDSRSGKIPD